MAYSFDPSARRIILSNGTTTLDVRDVYSRWKDWVAQSDNTKYLPAFSVTGGDAIDANAGTYIPAYAFLLNGWRIRPQEATHTLNVVGGVLLVDGGGDPFVNTLGSFIVRINYSQPVQAITVSTTGGSSSSITVTDIINGILDELLESHVVAGSVAAGISTASAQASLANTSAGSAATIAGQAKTSADAAALAAGQAKTAADAAALAAGQAKTSADTASSHASTAAGNVPPTVNEISQGVLEQSTGNVIMGDAIDMIPIIKRIMQARV